MKIPRFKHTFHLKLMDTSLSPLTLMLMILVFTTTLTSSTPILNSTTDHEALLAFKTAITDPLGVLRNNWSSNTSACYWTGVSCTLNRVKALNLSGLELHGALPPHLGNLTFLQSLDIRFNNFSGSIPSQLSHLQRMKVLNVEGNQLTSGGGVFTNMSSLIEVNMRDNKLSGELPNDMCRNTPELRRIYLSGNQLHGRIPASLHECRKLEELRLSKNQFSGSIPSELGNLTVLRELIIYSNHLEGDFPSFIFNISALEYVDLSINSLSGSLPAFNNLPHLEYLYLNDNNFTGSSIPKEIEHLPSLKLLILFNNQLTGDIPKQIGNLTQLETLDLALNKLGGELPEELGNLANINELQAGYNDFLNGSIPASIFNLSKLTKLALQQNQLSGTLPSTMGFSLSNLKELYLYWNRLSGEIPTSINNASKLTVLELNNNSFTGSVPDFGNLRLLRNLLLWSNHLTGEESQTQELRFLTSLTNSPDLKYLEISDNPMMSGVLPTSVGNLSTSLFNFLASGCSIRGVIPSEFGNISSLQVINLSRNQLEGFIPATIGRLKQLGKLYLYDNRLQGYIPHELCTMSNLMNLQLMQNMLIGSIPECLGEVKSLRKVSFSSNNLNSTLPPNFFDLADLITLDLSFNNLSGQIPNNISKLKVINRLDLSSNKFSGYIPNSFDSLKSLEYLNLSNNMFNGSIPESFDELKGLKDLDLSNNHLSGFIPKSLVHLDLELFNVSFNQLEGEIPDEGCFRELGAESFLNNHALCGPARFQVPPRNHGRSKRRSVAQLMIYIVPPILAVVALVVGILVLIRRCKPKKQPPKDDLSLSVGWKIISEREIRQATSCFSETHLLGKGGMGSVFKAKLADETEVAVKVFNLQVEGATKSFETESRILSSIRHRNLVKILGCCSNLDFKALILAYMPNGSLEKWLHVDKHCLDLVQRLKIAIDVALALEYLHHHHTFTVVHCDIKPNNVLLDADMTAHVADFGIAKLIYNDEAAVHTRNMATIGYAAPELGEGKISTSGDVYSYGILLMDLFTSKRPTDDMFDAEMSIKDWVEKALKEDGISEIVAPGLLSREDPHFHGKLRCVSSIFELAMSCSASSPQKRLDMMQVVVALHKIKFPVLEI